MDKKQDIFRSKSNRYLLRKIAHGKRVVDCFSHTGGFALNAAMGNASHVVSVDVSKTALDRGYQNAKLNHLEEKIDFVQADVFDYLDELKENEFDIIVLIHQHLRNQEERYKKLIMVIKELINKR
ncbi:MAG: class I SAM-dependent methyltransferase [Faecalibacillus faecis]